MDDSAMIYVVDDDASVCEALTLFLETEGYRVEAYTSSRKFLDAWSPGCRGCIILDVSMPGIDGLALQRMLHARGTQLPVIFLTGQGDVPQAVQAIKEGAVDFLEKPASNDQILERIRTVLADAARRDAEQQVGTELLTRYERLTERQREIMGLVTSGLSNKEIARKLHISTRTAEGHRLRVMEKMQAASLCDLIQMAQVCEALEKPHAAGEN